MALLKKCICGKNIPYHIDKCESCKEDTRKRDRKTRYSKGNIRYTTFYNNTPWRTLSDIVKTSYNGLCVVCVIEHGEIVGSDTTHHIEELREDWEQRLVESNLIPLCHSCHNSFHSDYKDEDKIYLKNIIKKYKIKFKI